MLIITNNDKFKEGIEYVMVSEGCNYKKGLNITKCGCDLEVMIRAFQALRPGSIPGVRIPSNLQDILQVLTPRNC